MQENQLQHAAEGDVIKVHLLPGGLRIEEVEEM